MCTLIAVHRWIRGAPLVVAANRDEFHGRPASPPVLRATPAGPVVMPVDRRAGGTWLGLNGRGVFAAVTNRRCERPDPARRSRGLLVVDALRARSAVEAMEGAESLVSGDYNPFNLFVADGRDAFAITWEDGPRRIELGPGVHVIGNTAPDAPSAKVERIAKRAERVASGPAERVLDGLVGICRGHEGAGDPLEDTCVHAGDYGTRSSTLMWLADRRSDRRLWFCDGAPCRTDYDDFTPLLANLDRQAGNASESTTRNVP